MKSEIKIGDIITIGDNRYKACKEVFKDSCYKCEVENGDCYLTRTYRECNFIFKKIEEPTGLSSGYVKYNVKNKHLFENEEEAIKYYKSVIRLNDYDKIDMNFVIGMTKQHGYIKQSPLEKAREIYEHLKKYLSDTGGSIHEDIVDYINELEKKVKELER
ncbi:MAG: hypothetical protein PVF17_00840 [Ignavibacteria bacterium]|jgi:hypothetical protein